MSGEEQEERTGLSIMARPGRKGACVCVWVCDWLSDSVELCVCVCGVYWRDSDLVEDVKVPFTLILAHHSGFLQEEVGDFPPVRLSSSAELDLKVFTLPETHTIY